MLYNLKIMQFLEKIFICETKVLQNTAENKHVFQKIIKGNQFITNA